MPSSVQRIGHKITELATFVGVVEASFPSFSLGLRWHLFSPSLGTLRRLLDLSLGRKSTPDQIQVRVKVRFLVL